MHASAIYFEQDRKFYNFIIITMILTSTHDSAIRWKEVLGVLFRRFPCSMIYAPS